MSLEQCNIAVQTVLPDSQIPAGASLVVFARSLAGSIGSALGQNIYQDNLSTQLAGILPASALSASGATTLLSTIRDVIGEDNEALYQDALRGINFSLTRVFMVATVLCCLTLPPALVIEWKSVKTEKRGSEDAREELGRKKKRKDKMKKEGAGEEKREEVRVAEALV